MLLFIHSSRFRSMSLPIESSFMQCGDEFTLSGPDGAIAPIPGMWQTLTSYIKMNTAGKHHFLIRGMFTPNGSYQPLCVALHLWAMLEVRVPSLVVRGGQRAVLLLLLESDVVEVQAPLTRILHTRRMVYSGRG